MKKWFGLFLLLCALVLPVYAEDTPTEIRTPQELAAMAENPGGSYILMEDLNMEGFDWNCFDFSGTLDGNGHSILNLSVTQPGENTATALDGNQKEYPAVYAGLFARLENAEIRNLGLINLRALVETDEPCLLGGIAGYSMDSTITDCSVTGRLELRAYNSMYGLGGLAGYGVGDIVGCKTDVTLICVDTDDSTMDFQFMGGAYAAGFMTVENCDIKLDGYISEHGYVHSGGVVGMLMQYPIAMGRSGLITDNTVSGKVSFFEHSDRYHGYCGKVYGDLKTNVNFNYRIADNDAFVERNETRDYSRELRPETCEKPDYEKTVVPADCTHFGYTKYTCKGCGYTFLSDYQLHTSHSISEWKVIKPATRGETGESVGKCDVCGAEETRIDPILTEPEPETVPETEPETRPETTAATEAVTEPETIPVTEPETVPETVQPEKVPSGKRPSFHLLWILALIAVILVAMIWRMLAYKPQHAKKRKKKEQ